MSRDTVNQLLLHGAEHHDRDGVFMNAEGVRWAATPDWRADRHSIRIAIALRDRFGVRPGDTNRPMALGPEEITLPAIQPAPHTGTVKLGSSCGTSHRAFAGTSRI